MNETYLNLAEGFEKVAAGLRDLAKSSNTIAAKKVVEEVLKEEVKEEPTVNIENVRAVLADKSRNGKTKDVKALLMKYDAGKLSDVKQEDYRRLLSDAEVL